ncbi:MAG: MlaD family protein [Pelosinus sp.]|nr:MlaD family protein [Pelosinus sp.]
MSNEAKVGGFTVAGLMLLAYMIIHLSGFSFGDKGYEVQAVFSHVNGLKPGNVVRFAGVDVGKVTLVQVVPEGIRATLEIGKGVQIPESSRFSIGADGLLGEKYIEITPAETNGRFLAPNSVVYGVEPQGLDTLIASADSVLGDVQKLVRSLNDILGDEKVKASLKDSAINAKAITENLSLMSAAMARMAMNNEADVAAMVQNLKGMAVSLNSVSQRIDKMVASVDNDGQTASDLREALANIRITSARVEKMAAALEGVVTDPKTASNIKETLKNARDASEKANKMLSKLDSIKVQPSVDVLYNFDSGKYKTNADVRIATSPQDFAIIGASNIGDSTKANLQIGRGNERFATRAGLIDGKAGLGIDSDVTSQLRLSVDVYDPNDLRVKFRTQYQVAPDTYFVGENDSLNKNAGRNTYFGVKRSF